MAGMMEQLVGHQEQKNWLLQQSAKGELPSSLIFQGSSGIGKKFLAKALLQTINCTKVSDGACGLCSDCVRVAENKNELIHIIEPEGKKNIGVDQVRETRAFLSLRSMKPARFIIIDPADKLTVAAANSLLKVLEEAPEKTFFILITEKMRSLLPTIRSRSHILKFTDLTRDELSQTQEFDEVALSWSDGRLHQAQDLQDKKMVDQLNDSLQFLYALICESPQDWKKKAPWFFSDDATRDFTFNVWKQALEKRLYNTGENLDWLPEQPQHLSGLFETMESLKGDLAANMDKLLAIEGFYYKARSLELYQ